jgi:hypothetical protein
MVLISGTNNIDELILSQIMICFHQVLMEILDKNLLEIFILDIENYAKICVAIDEMISLQGIYIYAFLYIYVYLYMYAYKIYTHIHKHIHI